MRTFVFVGAGCHRGFEMSLAVHGSTFLSNPYQTVARAVSTAENLQRSQIGVRLERVVVLPVEIAVRPLACSIQDRSFPANVLQHGSCETSERMRANNIEPTAFNHFWKVEIRNPIVVFHVNEATDKVQLWECSTPSVAEPKPLPIGVIEPKHASDCHEACDGPFELATVDVEP